MEWTPGVPPFPDALTFDPDPPKRLYARGDAELLLQRRVAIVGARRCTAYGHNIARRLGAELAEAGVVVVSGLAIGIDGAAHEGVLTAGGRPIGVVATSLDDVYPRRHRALWERVGRDGLLLSENGLRRTVDRWNFPKRNRIIAALAEIVVVVESTVKGGSMHTVNAAMARGIDVMAVPGPVGSEVSEGTNKLLVDGAAPVLGAEQVLDALNIMTAPRLFTPEARSHRTPEAQSHSRLSAAATGVLRILDFVPMTTDRLVETSGLGRGDVLVALQELSAAGKANGGGGWWSRSV